jgi:transposase InsO family protein
MPWKERTVKMNREDFVKQVTDGEKSLSEVCREFGISRPTGYKWLERYRNGEELSDRSRAPFHTANKTPQDMESMLLAYRKQHPAIGAVKVKRILENKGYTGLPCASTVNAIFKRNGCITPEASAAATPYKRYEKSYPNQMLQADFKGNFAMKNGARCHPLNIIDDYSRFNLCSDALSGETLASIKPSITRIFEEYGLPFSFLCDNGNPWGTQQSTGFTSFEVWLMDLGILTLHGRIRHPQTQGKDESYNRAMTKELLKHTEIADIKDAQKKFDEYRRFYNEERPHFGIGLDVPAKRYRPSERRMPRRITEWEYPSSMILRRVKETGFVTFGGQGYFFSEAFAGRMIGIRDSHIPGCISLFYRQFRIGRINVDDRAVVMRKAFLIDGDPRFSRD